MNFKVVLEPQEEGGYTVYVPALPGCVSQGETAEEAMTNIRGLSSYTWRVYGSGR